MPSRCARCKRIIDTSRESSVKIPGAKQKSICSSCHIEWKYLHDYYWHQFLDPPKNRTPRGLSAARQVGIVG